MRPAGVLKSIPGIEAAGALSPKTQSPSTLGWRLRVEVRHTRRSETTVGSDTPLGLMDSRRYRKRGYAMLVTFTSMGSRRTGLSGIVALPLVPGSSWLTLSYL